MAKTSSETGLSEELKATLNQLAGFKTNANGELVPEKIAQSEEVRVLQGDMDHVKALLEVINVLVRQQDRKSTRLNSSH